jgi:hypothetical protein
MRTPRLIAIVAVGLLLSPACALLTPPRPAGAPPLSTVGKIATYGRQFVVAGDGALTGLDLALGVGVIPRESGVAVLSVMKKIGDESVKLAPVLRAIDKATTGLERSSALSNARAIVAGITAAFDEALLPLPDGRSRTIVQAILNTAKALVLDFGGTLASGTTLVWNDVADSFEQMGRTMQARVDALTALLQ